MYCLKCGGETPEQQLFCPDCLQSMEEYPVRADTPIQLPKRQAQVPAKRSRQKEVPPEVLLPKLRAKIRRLSLCICLLILALALTLATFFFNIFQEEEEPTLTGRNYKVTEQK